ncbi:hypothetical protein BDN72DRAFT_348001 [Pluteus cervinus]|uniref:Uncharacterized protein n=1 Tax=Pluteus cervinus TaxID=181527 RepID=A0ACD3ABQ2_9AGAR|nr:hypothetical protein BDN72DRAFT_348001 [Pluteus cervinus]
MSGYGKGGSRVGWAGEDGYFVVAFAGWSRLSSVFWFVTSYYLSPSSYRFQLLEHILIRVYIYPHLSCFDRSVAIHRHHISPHILFHHHALAVSINMHLISRPSLLLMQRYDMISSHA